MYNVYIDDLLLPIAPPSISTKINNKNETITLINEGEVNILKKAGLTDISFEFLLPNSKYPFAVYPNGYQPAQFYLDKIEQLKIAQKPFQFIVIRTKPDGKVIFDTNITVSLEEYSIEEDAENGFDINVPIELKQFVPFGTKKLLIQSNPTAPAAAKTATVEKSRATTGKKQAKTYTVKANDTLWGISKKQFGTGDKVDFLAKLNKLSNPNLLKVGQVLRLE